MTFREENHVKENHRILEIDSPRNDLKLVFVKKEMVEVVSPTKVTEFIMNIWC